MTDTSSRPTRPSQTKIVATLGPASSEPSQIADLLKAGVDVFRVNMAHGSREQHEACLAAIRGASAEVGQQAAVLIDLAGPKIRLGELPGGEIHCAANAPVRFVRGETARDDPIELTTTYETLVDELDVGDRIMLADGTVSLAVEQVDTDSALCRVTQSGPIRSRQGVNLPGVKLSTPALSPVDRDNAIWAAGADIDFVGLSFVRTAEEIRELKTLLTSNGSQAQVIAKIEKPEALENLAEIVEATDGIMVARGDLGVEIDIARVAVAQKEIVAMCNRHRKPVIIATQMLDSMQHARVPTRAEVTDVANAILDGADACMLSGETAIGKHPRLAVEMMHRIALATEPLCRNQPERPMVDLEADGMNPITEATVHAAGRMAEALHADLLLVGSGTGKTALALSKNRHYVSTIGVSDSPATLRRMCLYWGIIPLADAPTGDNEALLEYIDDFGRKTGHLGPGDRIVSITGTGLSVTAHNAIVVHELK